MNFQYSDLVLLECSLKSLFSNTDRELRWTRSLHPSYNYFSFVRWEFFTRWLSCKFPGSQSLRKPIQIIEWFGLEGTLKTI